MTQLIGAGSTPVKFRFTRPLVAPLVILGWGASMGAIVGATVSAVNRSPPVAPDKQNWLSELIGD